jgi:hypothetical protein
MLADESFHLCDACGLELHPLAQGPDCFYARATVNNG